MKLFLTTVKKIVQQGNTQTVGAASFAGLQYPAGKLTPILSVLTNVTSGLKMVGGLIIGTVPETLGHTLTNLISGSPLPAQTPGLSNVSLLDNTGSVQDTPAAEVVQITYNLTHDAGATSASGGSPWASSTNAQGLHNGSSATCANTLTASTSGAALTLSYAAQNATRSALTITQVQIVDYSQYAPGAIGPGTVRVEYSLNAGTSWTALRSPTTAAWNSLSAGQAFDITAAIGGDWSLLGTNLRVRYVHTAAAGATPSTLTVDAAELVINATTTQFP